MIGKLCNGAVAIVLATFSTVEILSPIDGAKGLYYGIPEELLTAADPSAQLTRHFVAAIGALHFGLAACLLLSTGASVEVQRNAAIGTTIGMVAHIAACFRIKAFAGHVVDPLHMPTGALLFCVVVLAMGLVVEGDTDEVERATAIKTAEQKEFKGDMMENREYVKKLEEAGIRGKKTKKAD